MLRDHRRSRKKQKGAKGGPCLFILSDHAHFAPGNPQHLAGIDLCRDWLFFPKKGATPPKISAWFWRKILVLFKRLAFAQLFSLATADSVVGFFDGCETTWRFSA